MNPLFQQLPSRFKNVHWLLNALMTRLSLTAYFSLGVQSPTGSSKLIIGDWLNSGLAKKRGLLPGGEQQERGQRSDYLATEKAAHALAAAMYHDGGNAVTTFRSPYPFFGITTPSLANISDDATPTPFVGLEGGVSWREGDQIWAGGTSMMPGAFDALLSALGSYRARFPFFASLVATGRTYSNREQFTKVTRGGGRLHKMRELYRGEDTPVTDIHIFTPQAAILNSAAFCVISIPAGYIDAAIAHFLGASVHAFACGFELNNQLLQAVYVLAPPDRPEGDYKQFAIVFVPQQESLRKVA